MYNLLVNEKTGKIHILEAFSDSSTFCHCERKEQITEAHIRISDHISQSLSQCTCEHCIKRVSSIYKALALSS